MADQNVHPYLYVRENARMEEIMDNRLQGKTVIITGAAGGIGEVLSEKLAECGMNIVLTGRRKEALEAVAEKVEQMGGRACVCAGELSDMNFLEELLERTQAAFGGVDVLINNAGLSHRCPVEEMTPELFESIMKVNVQAPYFLCQKAVPYLRKSNFATIINIGSVVSHKGYPLQSVYAASKHALLGFSKSLANEVFKENIRVHVISPGSVFTDMIASVRPDLSPEGMILPEDMAEIVIFYLEHRHTNAVIDEIEVHRVTKEPFA